MPIGYGGTPRQYPLPAETFPSLDTPEGRLLQFQLEMARQRDRAMGLRSHGLLDRVPYIQPLGTPQPQQGLLQPASLLEAIQRIFGGQGGVSSYAKTPAKTRRHADLIDITRFGPRISPRSGGVWYYGLDGGYKPLTIEDLLSRDQR